MSKRSPAAFNSPRQRARHALFGLSAIGLGTLALLDNLHVFGIPLLRTYWPLVFVPWGLFPLLWPRHPGSRVIGVLLILVGALMTAHNLGYADLSLRKWWPVYLILAGVAIVIQGLFSRSRGWGWIRFETSTVEHTDEINIDTTFSGIKLRNDSRNFKGGLVDTSFSGLELDLREAVMDGPEVAIQIDGTFSGIELRVPRDWLVVVHLSATMGGVWDKSTPPATPNHRLILRGGTTFGYVEIKN